MDILGWEIRATLNLSSLAQWNETSSFLCALSIHMCLCLCIFVPVLVACERYFEWWDETLSWGLPAQCQKPPVAFPPLPHTPADGINLGWKWVIIGVLEHHFSFAFCARSNFSEHYPSGIILGSINRKFFFLFSSIQEQNSFINNISFFRHLFFSPCFQKMILWSVLYYLFDDLIHNSLESTTEIFY